MKERKKERDRQRGQLSVIGERGKNSERALNKTLARADRITQVQYQL